MKTQTGLARALEAKALALAFALVAPMMPVMAHAQDLPGVETSDGADAANSDAGQAGDHDDVFFKKNRVPPLLDFKSDTGEKVSGFSQSDDEKPSKGTGIFERMGIDLPPLPPEKPFKGKVDEAYGAYQRGRYITALDLALPRAKLGDPAAQTLLAELLSTGRGVKRDVDAATFWYSQAAEAGDPNGMFKYALILMEGRLAKRDKKKADELMHKAADAGVSLAEFNWAQILVADKAGSEGLREALPYYEKAAEKGIADAQYALSQIYLNLPGLDEAKRQEAKVWLERAAKAGYDTAQYDMGVWLVNGIEFDQNLEAGFEWMKRAAMQGNILAANKLSHLYINAIGTKPDPVEAAKWYIISRRAGLEDPDLEDFYLGIDEEKQKAAIEAANRQRRG